ncbi:uncharacterized protein LOC103516778 [Diaphorina citri]|uniref:Uncharacterized protein LOC103516778 n=1 Tax=Diaphorina citri TaxID=121845 RepID=A0A1S3DFJ4_DIACI|nr:uncharacterized protein LOC103516778 [Diaphorina citri]
MNQVLFTKKEQDQIEESILKITNINVRSVIKRTKHDKVIRQLCYLLGCEIVDLNSIIGQEHTPNLTFGAPFLCNDNDTSTADQSMNETARNSYHHGNQPKLMHLNQLLTMRRKIEKCVNKVLQNRIHSFLFSSNKFLCYSKENMMMDKNSMLSNLKKIEIIKIEDKKVTTQTITQEAEYVSDLGNIYVQRGMDKYNAVQTQLDMESLQRDYAQYNKDMMRMFVRSCGKSSVNFFKHIYQASMLDHPDDHYVSVQCRGGMKVVPYLSELGIIQHHPNNDRLVKLANV